MVTFGKGWDVRQHCRSAHVTWVEAVVLPPTHEMQYV